jgi:amino acid permease
VQYSVGGFLGAAVGILLSWLLIKAGLISAFETCDSYPNPNLQMVEQEGFGRYCGYTWGAIFVAGAIPVSICSVLGVVAAKAVEGKL